MRKPGPATYLFGNPATVLAAVGATAFFGYQWWSNDSSPLPAIVAFLIACQSMRSSDQLQKYNEWKREWDALEGRASPARGGSFTLTPALRFAIALPAWGIGVYMALTIGDDPMGKLGALLFWLASAVAVCVLLFRLVRPLWQKRQPKKAVNARDPVVSICVKPPQASPALPDAYRQLPAYCRALFR